jgi:hypothetical protein
MIRTRAARASDALPPSIARTSPGGDAGAPSRTDARGLS